MKDMSAGYIERNKSSLFEEHSKRFYLFVEGWYNWIMSHFYKEGI